MKFKVCCILILAIISLFFSYRLLEVPMGLTVDEAAFGYNAVLLSKTGHDQNGKLLPVFVLSIDGRDYRQPIPQYYMAIFLKIFGASVFNLRLSSVLIVLISAVLIYFLGKILIGKLGGILAVLFFLTTPLVLIQSHLALDNITPIPFAIGWLVTLFLYQKKSNPKYLIFSGIILGLSLYTYKGMRAVVPVWFILTLVYLWIQEKKNLIFFIIGILPFFIIMPILEFFYPGAILGGQKPDTSSAYSFLYNYLASFDLSFLFISGDSTIHHSTGIHGMFLVATLPVFIIGIFRSIKNPNSLFLLAAYISGPLLFGLTGSVHRASRLMMLIPLYSLISAIGMLWMLQINFRYKKILLVVTFIFMLFNFFDFTKFYWFTYPKLSENAFGKLKVYESYQVLSEEAEEKNLTPFIAKDLADGEGETSHFYEVIYFNKLIDRWPSNDVNPPSGSIMLTTREDIPGMERLEKLLPYYHLQINPR